uniref:Uncharacterized protein n=1 Tax=Amphimedon queenslandica TaxID=400682 RepID=A0A1X7TS89_AMPQE
MVGSWNCYRHWAQSSACTSSTSNIYCGTGASKAGNETRSRSASQVKTPPVLFIFCLLILLFISGDVELNPGPTLTDKPTKDELVELLSSSKFTAGTWEQFVCCLPNMTQEVLSNIIIKQKEELEDIKPLDSMRDVAQCCLNNNVTWRNIIVALLDAGEITLAHIVLDEHSGTNLSNNVYRTVKQVLRSHYSKLMETTKTCLSKVAKCLSTAGGPAQEEAIALARDWENEVFKHYQVLFSLTKVVTEFIPKEVQLSSSDSLAMELKNLHKKYAKLMADIATYYASSEEHRAIDLARWVQHAYKETGLAHDGVTIDEIFERMLPLHSFIDIDAINDLMEANPIDDSVLQARFDEYSDSIDKFIDSVQLNDIVKTIEAAIIGESTKVDPKIILKLSGRWNDQTIGHVYKLLKYLFNEEAKYVTIKKFLRGSICIQFLVFFKGSIQPLIMKSQLIIDNQTIIDREEDISFTFEESLLHSITKLKIELNYQNSKGQTALMLTSVGGHIKIFESLLQNCSNPFVQLSSNKGYVGLNYLACTALSQHIYKSIGGERIIPQDDTSVEGMVKMVVKEKRVSSHFYEPFIYIIKNNLKEKFQCLQKCFHALDSSSLDVATNILTSKALMTEAKQNFQSYIKEDATCENAHQLVQLLQPHYSCLNINLLTIPCTITEPIKEQVEAYNTNLKMFKDTTSLLELAMMTRGMQFPDGVGCSKMILRFKKPWCSRTISDLNKMEKFYLLPISSFLTLQEVHCNALNLKCVYLLPQLQTETSIEVVFEQRVSLYKIGLFEVMIDDVTLMMGDEDKSFTFEAALQEAHQNNNEKVLLFLLELNITSPIEKNDFAYELMIASKKGDFLTVQFLLSKDADINIENNDGWTALMFASANGYYQVVELLLSKNPDINIQNNNGWTALMIANSNGHHQIAELLLSKDPNINIQDNDGGTALMAVASGNDEDLPMATPTTISMLSLNNNKREQQQQLITQARIINWSTVHEHEEQTVKLLDDEEESVTSEKTIVQSLIPNKPYDKEIMEQYLDDQYQSRQYLRDIEEGEDHTELELGNKEKPRPSGQRPPLPLFVGAQKHKKSIITHLAFNNEERNMSFGGNRLQLITQVHEHEEQTVKLLNNEEESVTSEKTIVQSLIPNKPYDEERMKKYLDDQYRSRQYLQDIEESEDHTELEPGDKEELRPNSQRPPPLLFVGAQKHKKSTITHLASNNEGLDMSFGGDRLHKLSPSANPPGVTVSVMLPPPSSLSLFPSSFQDDNGYTHHQDFHTKEGTDALNKTTPTATKLDDIELDLLISPEDEVLPMTTPTTVSMLSLNNNAPSTIGGLNVMQHPPINIQTSDYLPSVPLQALPTHTRPPTGRSTENTPIPSNSSSLLSLATVEGQGGSTSSGNESKQSKDSCLEPPGSFERNIRKNEMLYQGRRRMREGSRRTKGGRKSSSRQSFASRSLSNRSSSSSGILSSGGSTDSVFLSNPSIIRDPPRHPSNLSLTKTSSGGCPLPTGAGPSRTRRSSWYESDPNTPKAAQSIDGQNKGGLDVGTTFFPFLPTTLSSTIDGSQNSLAALPQKDTITLQQSVVGDYIVEANNVTGMNVMSDQTKFPLSAINTEYISEPTWPPFSNQKNIQSISPPPLSPHLLSPLSISPLSPSPPTSPFSFSPPVSPTKSFSAGLNQQKPATLPSTNASRRSSVEDTKRRASLQLTPVQELLNMKRNSLDSTNVHTPSLSTTSSFMTLQHQTPKTPTTTTFSSNFSPSPFSSLSFLPPLSLTASTNSSLPCSTTQANTPSSLYSTVSQLTPLKSMGSVSKSVMSQPVGPSLFSTPLGSLSSSKPGASFGLSMSQSGSNATGTDYLPAIPPVSPTRINLKQPSVVPTAPVINGGMRRQTTEENTSYPSNGRNDSRKQSLDYVANISGSNPFTVPLSSSFYAANVTSTTAAQSSTVVTRQSPTTPSYTGIPSFYSFKSSEQKSHPTSSSYTTDHAYLKVADSTVSQSQQLLDNGGLQSIINDELPSLPPELATVPVTPTRTDSVTSEVDDSYSIPSMTSSIQELINNNEEEEGDSMPFSIEQFIDESPSAAAARTNDYIS